MNGTINSKLAHLEKHIIPLLNNASGAPILRYNTICSTYFDNEFLAKAGISGGVGGMLLKASSFHNPTWVPVADALPSVSSAAPLGLPAVSEAAVIADGGVEVLSAGAVDAMSGIVLGEEAATTAGTSIVASTVEATTAAGGSALAVYLPLIAAAIGGFMIGKAIGDVVLNKLVLPKKGEKELKKLEQDVKVLKRYCKSMSSQLSVSMMSLNIASKKIDQAAIKINKLEYKTKKENLKRLKSRKTEIATMYRDMAALKQVIGYVNANLSKIA